RLSLNQTGVLKNPSSASMTFSYRCVASVKVMISPAVPSSLTRGPARRLPSGDQESGQNRLESSISGIGRAGRGDSFERRSTTFPPPPSDARPRAPRTWGTQGGEFSGGGALCDLPEPAAAGRNPQGLMAAAAPQKKDEALPAGRPGRPPAGNCVAGRAGLFTAV